MKHVSILELEIPFRFFGALVVGSALMIMARSFKEAALLGGTFLCGLGALELALRFSGYCAKPSPAASQEGQTGWLGCAKFH